MMADTQARGRPYPAKRLLVSVSIVIVSLVALVGLPEFSNLVEARHKVRSLVIEIARLRQDNDALRAKARSLREDPAAIEDVARRELGMLRRGEILFIIKDVPSPAHKEPAPPKSPLPK